MWILLFVLVLVAAVWLVLFLATDPMWRYRRFLRRPKFRLIQSAGPPRHVVLATRFTSRFRRFEAPPKFRLIESIAPPDERVWKWEVLTEREIEIVQMVLDGKRNSEIAQSLFLGTHTVGNYLQRIYKKLNVHNRVQLMRAVRDYIR